MEVSKESRDLRSSQVLYFPLFICLICTKFLIFNCFSYDLDFLLIFPNVLSILSQRWWNLNTLDSLSVLWTSAIKNVTLTNLMVLDGSLER